MEMMDAHAGIHEQFAVHRDFVVGLEFQRALEELEKFERMLRAHMDVEEAHVLPLYRERVGKIPGGDPEFFHLEHKNILRNLETAKDSLRQLAANPASGRRQVHQFLDQEWMLLHLLEHHDMREKNTLYPKLDEALSEQEREALLVRCGVLKD